jgi:acyl-CoA synthetase (AMP-forming)/AMP-acid ligase II
MNTTAADHHKLTTRAKRVVNVWGMTEGVWGIGYRSNETPVWQNDIMSCGRALPATAAKVCEPESTQIVQRYQLGELHISGPNMIQGYYQAGKLVQNGSFYHENGRTWFKTGDTVIMDECGNIFVTGRYKDLIIRGGENIHPRLIERCLDKLPGVKVITGDLH